jgi:hypothetical protein
LAIDGFETQLGTNHLGHFVMIDGIASLIRDGGLSLVIHPQVTGSTMSNREPWF